MRKEGHSESYVPNVMMLTADVALLHDPIYMKHVKYYASNLTALTEDFGKAWYKVSVAVCCTRTCQGTVLGSQHACSICNLL